MLLSRSRKISRMKVVYFTRAFPFPDLADSLAERFAVRMEKQDIPLPREKLFQNLRDVNILVCTLTERIDRDVLDHAPALELVATYSVGYDHLDLAALRERGIWATHTPDVLTEATADLTWALILAAARRVVEADAFVRKGGWQGWQVGQFLGMELSGKTLGIVGAGRIGQAVGRRAVGFGLRILYTARRGKPDFEEATGARFTDLDTLLGASDIVSLHVPLTPETRNLLSRERLFAMKPGSILINTARGAVVDEEALMEALEAGHLAAVGLDVYAKEPFVPEALRRHPRAVLLPHLGSATVETRRRMFQAVVESILSFAAGERPPRHAIPELVHAA